MPGLGESHAIAKCVPRRLEMVRRVLMKMWFKGALYDSWNNCCTAKKNNKKNQPKV